MRARPFRPAAVSLVLWAGLLVPMGAARAADPVLPAVLAARVPGFAAPADIHFRSTSLLSDGVRLHAEVFAPQAQAGALLPTVIQAHGWGGTAAGLRADAVTLARAGYRVVNFDYRGWGGSDGRLVLAASPDKVAGRRFSAEVEELREYVDPLEQVADWLNVLHWAAGEPGIDPGRIGLRGSSYSGGHVVLVASQDARVRALVSQVGGFQSDWVMSPGARGTTLREATQRTHGEIGYPEPRSRAVGQLIGAPIRDKLARHAPLDAATRLRTPALFIVAEGEELFDNRLNAQAAFDAMPGEHKRYVAIPGIRHYGIYREAREQTLQLAIEWFDQHLNGGGR